MRNKKILAGLICFAVAGYMIWTEEPEEKTPVKARIISPLLPDDGGVETEGSDEGMQVSGKVKIEIDQGTTIAEAPLNDALWHKAFVEAQVKEKQATQKAETEK